MLPTQMYRELSYSFLSCYGRFLPQLIQNLEVSPLIPHEQFHGASGRFVPHSGQKLPLVQLLPQLHTQPVGGTAPV